MPGEQKSYEQERVAARITAELLFNPDYRCPDCIVDYPASRAYLHGVCANTCGIDRRIALHGVPCDKL